MERAAYSSDDMNNKVEKLYLRKYIQIIIMKIRLHKQYFAEYNTVWVLSLWKI